MPTTQSPINQVSSISDILLQEHLINQAQHKEIKLKAATEGQSEESIIENLRFVDEDKLSEIKARMLGVPFISLEGASFSPQALSFVPQAVVQRFNLIPFAYDDRSKSLSIAMANPVDLDALC